MLFQLKFCIILDPSSIIVTEIPQGLLIILYWVFIEIHHIYVLHRLNANV